MLASGLALDETCGTTAPNVSDGPGARRHTRDKQTWGEMTATTRMVFAHAHAH
jgi:hypothetical protein